MNNGLRKLRDVVQVLVVLALLVNTAYGGLGQGREAYLGVDYATALRELRPLSEQGNATAQFYLGLMYDAGDGVSKDYQEAMKWYLRAAAKDQRRRS